MIYGDTSYQGKHLDESKLKDDIYILCECEDACKFLFRELNRLGFTWPKGECLDDTHWSDYKGSICYKVHLNQKTIQYNNEESVDYLRRSWEVVDIDDLIRKELHLSDLSSQDQCNIKAIVDMFHDRREDDKIYLICRDPSLLNLLVEGALSHDWYLTNRRAWEGRNYQCESGAIGIVFSGNYMYQVKSDSDVDSEYQEIDWDYVHMFDVLYKKLGDDWEEFPPKVRFSFKHEESTQSKGETKSEDVIESSESMNKEKEKKNMNMFGNLNMEFGMNTDERIRSTFMGIAVQHDGSWKIYDKSAKTLTDIGDMNVGSLPLFVMPATKLEEGDLIKKDDGYYYVVESKDDKIRTISASTGKMEAAVPTDNILGIRFYSKIVAIAEDLISDISGDDSTDKLMMAMAMSSMSGDSEDYSGDGNIMNNQMLLPLLLLKDNKKTDDDTEGGSKKSDTLKKFMLMSMMSGNNGANNQNAILPLLLLKGDLF